MLEALIARLRCAARLAGYDAELIDAGPTYASLVIAGVDVQVNVTDKRIELVTFDWDYEDHQLMNCSLRRADELVRDGLARILAFRDALLDLPLAA